MQEYDGLMILNYERIRHDVRYPINVAPGDLNTLFKYGWITTYDCSCACIWNVGQIKFVSGKYILDVIIEDDVEIQKRNRRNGSNGN